MSELSYAKIHNTSHVLDGTAPTFYGIQNGCFDMHSLRYRVFGAVWKLKDGRKYILGYWFADDENEILCFIKDAGFIAQVKYEEDDMNEIYQTIRMEQDQDNWTRRCRMSLFSSFKKPWKNLRKGWYVIKSSRKFPCILTCIQKKKYTIWIEHIQVCENKNDAIKFMNLISLEHNFQFNPNGFKDSDYKTLIHLSTIHPTIRSGK